MNKKKLTFLIGIVGTVTVLVCFVGFKMLNNNVHTIIKI